MSFISLMRRFRDAIDSSMIGNPVLTVDERREVRSWGYKTIPFKRPSPIVFANIYMAASVCAHNTIDCDHIIHSDGSELSSSEHLQVMKRLDAYRDAQQNKAKEPEIKP